MKKISCLALLSAVVVTVAQGMEADTDKSPAKPFTREALHEVEARITAIDKAERKISLCCPNGVTTIEAGPEVHNFDNMHVGDKVRASYYEAIAAEIKKDGDSAQKQPAEVALLYRAPDGSRPAGAAGRAVTATVKVESIDVKANTLTVRRSGEQITFDIKSEEGKKFIRTLHRGDVVEVSYMEALAIEVVTVD